MSSIKLIFAFITLVLIPLALVGRSRAQLQVGFYSGSCPLAEVIVKDEVRKSLLHNAGLAAGFVILHYHDCFVRGCDGSVLIDSTPTKKAEKDSTGNNPILRELVLEVIDNAKARLESVCKGTVSCADIITFAARDSIEMTGGPGYDVPAGRRDGRTSLIAETRSLPPPTFNVDQLTQLFLSKGLTQDEMVTLSGAHTIGRAHCVAFVKRLYGFNSSLSQDPTLDSTYANQLMQRCPPGSDADRNTVSPNDPSSPNITDVGYYVNILNNQGLFMSDQSLLTSTATANQVAQYAKNPSLWRTKFAAAMVKMSQIDVLTGAQGEIRSNCRVIN